MLAFIYGAGTSFGAIGDPPNVGGQPFSSGSIS
jgi:hypothetical protein